MQPKIHIQNHFLSKDKCYKMAIILVYSTIQLLILILI